MLMALRIESVSENTFSTGYQMMGIEGVSHLHTNKYVSQMTFF